MRTSFKIRFEILIISLTKNLVKNKIKKFKKLILIKIKILFIFAFLQILEKKL
jgi:hypothetical protein